ncbi:hypothetical protein AB0L59_12115 [Streptomyces sp. NPDC052109]|uniref:hypothetical protein n=1 Tax=Streptomyces sp. NPDC052109 TaxID=3155527 RepID=UPI0034468121
MAQRRRQHLAAFLRVISRTGRAALRGTVLDYARQDAWTGRHLVEVTRQRLGDISRELLWLPGHPDTPPALVGYLRRVALRAGRGDRGTPWPGLFLEPDRIPATPAGPSNGGPRNRSRPERRRGRRRKGDPAAASSGISIYKRLFSPTFVR